MPVFLPANVLSRREASADRRISSFAGCVGRLVAGPAMGWIEGLFYIILVIEGRLLDLPGRRTITHIM